MIKQDVVFNNMQEARIYGKYADNKEIIEVFGKFSDIATQISIELIYNIQMIDEFIKSTKNKK